MKNKSEILKNSIQEFCSLIGSNRLIVQGAGGNISWKDQDILWIKASGKRLAEAQSKNIFVPVSLISSNKNLTISCFEASPTALEGYTLKPSIETFLHALMPQKIVLHLHPVEILVHLIRDNLEKLFIQLFSERIKWGLINYCKPGKELALAIYKLLKNKSDINVIFMKNHGVVIGGENIQEIEEILNELLFTLKNKIYSGQFFEKNIYEPNEALLQGGYNCSEDKELNQLALNPDLSVRLKKDWAISPDHIVFLGSKAAILDSNNEYKNFSVTPPFIFDIKKGLYIHSSATKNQKEQLQCYYDVLIRLNPSDKLSLLSDLSIAELLNWDAEKYRQHQ